MLLPSAITLGVALFAIWFIFWDQPAMSEAPSGLQITSWNVLNPAFENENWYDERVIPHLHWAQGRERVACDYLSSLDSHIFSLQEVNEEMVKSFVKSLNRKANRNKGPYEYVWKQRNRGQNDGCGTIFNSDVLSFEGEEVVRFPSGKHIMLATLFKAKGTDFSFWNVNTHVNWGTRNEDLAHMYKVVKGLQNTTVKFAMGDTNAEANEPWYNEVVKDGVADVVKDFLGEHPAFSYNSGKQKKWIDYIFSWGLDKSKVTHVFLGNDASNPLDLASSGPGLPSATLPSDHVPITFVFALP